MKRFAAFFMVLCLILSFYCFPVSAQESTKPSGAGWVAFKDTSGKYGFKDANGKVVIEPQFSIASDFSEGLAFVSRDPSESLSNFNPYGKNKYSYIDTTCMELFPYKYAYCTMPDFKDGLAIVRNHNGKYGVIDKTGNEIIRPQYDSMNYFSDGLAAVFKKTAEDPNGDSKYTVGYVDRTGKQVLPFQYDYGGTFNDNAYDFTNGMVTITIEDRWPNSWPLVGMMNKAGKVIIPPTQRADYSALPQYADGLITFTYLEPTNQKSEDGNPLMRFRAGIYDDTGKLIMDFTDRGYIEMGNLGHGFGWARSSTLTQGQTTVKWEVFDRTGKVVLSFPAPQVQGMLFEYRENLIYVKGFNDNTTGYFDPATGSKTTPKAPVIDSVKIVKGTITEGTYSIRPVANTRFDISISEASQKDGAKAILWMASDKENHWFQFTPAEDGAFTLTAKHSQQPLYANTQKGKSVAQKFPGSQFLFIEESSGIYRIKDKETGFYLGVSEGKMNAGTNIVTWTEASDESQTFLVVRQ